MDDYQEKNMKKELAIDSANTAKSAKITDASSILDMSQTIQQLLAMSSMAGGAILSPMQLLQASGSPGASTSQLSLPWIVPHHYQQMMVLQQGLAQPFLLSDVVDDKDGGHVVVMPTGDQVGHYGNASVVSSPSDLSAAQASVPGAHLFGTLDSNAGQLKSYQLSPAQRPAVVKEGVGQGQLTSSVDRVSSKRGPVQSPQGQLLPDSAKIPRPRPPKKPLTPYMMFSKEMWHQVKAANSHLSLVTEIGAIIGSMWRELDAEKKEHYNELFSRDKIRYDEEIRLYLKDHNMHPSDLIRARLSKKKDSKSLTQHRPPSHGSTVGPSSVGQQQQQQQLVQSLLGYPVAAADGTQALISLDGALPNSLMQAWAGQPLQQILAQMGLTGQLTQAAAAAAASSDDSQMNEASSHHHHQQQQQQQLALQANAMLSIASSVCGSSNELVASTAARSSDASAVSRMNAESAISAAEKSKLWSWCTGQHPNATTSSSSSSSMQTNRGTDCVAAAAPEESVSGRKGVASRGAMVHCTSVGGDWSEAKSDEANRLERRLLFLENALTEKNSEIETLVDQLGKAHRVIANFSRIEPDVAEGNALNGGGGGGGGGGRVVAAEVGSRAQHQ